MTNTHKNTKAIIGRSEVIELVNYNFKNIPARIDTGAFRSSIHATDISLNGKTGALKFTLLKDHPSYSSKTAQGIETSDFKKITTKNSFGQIQDRYAINLAVDINGKIITSSFSLSDRSNNNYPVLIGRKLLGGYFVVDPEITKTAIKDEEERVES